MYLLNWILRNPFTIQGNERIVSNIGGTTLECIIRVKIISKIFIKIVHKYFGQKGYFEIFEESIESSVTLEWPWNDLKVT